MLRPKELAYTYTDLYFLKYECVAYLLLWCVNWKRGLTSIADSCCGWWLQPSAVLPYLWFYLLRGLTCVADSCCSWWLQPNAVLQYLRILFPERINVCSWQLSLLMASAKCCVLMSVMLFLWGLMYIADSCCCWWPWLSAVLQCSRCH